MVAKGTGCLTVVLDAAMMAAGLGTSSAPEREAVSRWSAASLPGTINPAPYPSTYQGVRIPDHIADALNRMARR